MKLLVDRVKDTPQTFTFSADPTWCESAALRLPELGGEGAEPLKTEVRAYRVINDLLFEGRLEGALSLECSRCLARYRHALLEPYRLVLELAGNRVPADPEAAALLAGSGFCLGDELEMGWYQGHEIDLGPLWLEIAALAIPVKPICRENCRGLCPRCGVDRNQTECSCKERETSSPFAALIKLKRDTELR